MMGMAGRLRIVRLSVGLIALAASNMAGAE